MYTPFKRVFAGFMAASMTIAPLTVPAFAETTNSFATTAVTSDINTSDEVTELVSDLVSYYSNYQSYAQTDIDRLISKIKDIDESTGEMYEKIMDLWADINSDDFTVNENVLPDGLATDDSLAIVALGYGLNADGSMKDELYGRLSVVLASAQKYPNCYIVCTGGATAKNNAEATEGQSMADWLIEQGIDEDRIIVENKSANTVQNAQYTYATLTENYPQVTDVAVITSDYHVKRGTLLIGAQLIKSAYEDGKTTPSITVVSNAGYDTGKSDESISLQTMSLSQLLGISSGGPGGPGGPGSQSSSSKPTLSDLTSLDVELDSTTIVTGGTLSVKSATATYDTDNWTEDVTDDVTYSGFDSSRTGEQTVTFTYTKYAGTDYEDTISTDVTVNVVHKLTSLELTLAEDTYLQGDSLAIESVIATYSDDETADVTTDVTVSGYDSSTVGKQTVKVSYTENGVTKTAKATVRVLSAKYTVTYKANGKTIVTDSYARGSSYTTRTWKKKAWKAYGTKGANFSKWTTTTDTSGNVTKTAVFKSFTTGQALVLKVTGKKGKGVGFVATSRQYTKKDGSRRGFTFRYSTSKSMKNATTVTTGLTKNIYTKTGLKKGKTYYVQVRYYYYDSTMNRVYGAWSKVKSVKAY